MKSILCYGDSNTWGVDPEIQPPGPLYSAVRMQFEQRWPNVMQRALGDGYHVIEEGLNGRTAGVEDPCAEYRNGLATLFPLLLSHAPIDLILIMLGENDTKKRIGLDARDIVKGHERMVHAIRTMDCGPDQQIPPILLIAPPITGPNYTESYRESFGYGRKASLELPGVLQKVAGLLDCYYFDSNQVVTMSQLDGIHLDRAAHTALGNALAQFIQQNIMI